MPLRMVGRGVPPSRLGRGTRPACPPNHHPTNQLPTTNYQLPTNQLPTCLYVLQETTGTTCKNNILFLAAQPRGNLEIGRGLVRHSLGEGRMRPDGTSCFYQLSWLFPFQRNLSSFTFRAQHEPPHQPTTNHHPPTNYQPTNYQLPKTFRLLFPSRRRFDILISLRLEERSNIAWGRDPPPVKG